MHGDEYKSILARREVLKKALKKLNNDSSKSSNELKSENKDASETANNKNTKKKSKENKDKEYTVNIIKEDGNKEIVAAEIIQNPEPLTTVNSNDETKTIAVHINTRGLLDEDELKELEKLDNERDNAVAKLKYLSEVGEKVLNSLLEEMEEGEYSPKTARRIVEFIETLKEVEKTLLDYAKDREKLILERHKTYVEKTSLKDLNISEDLRKKFFSVFGVEVNEEEADV